MASIELCEDKIQYSGRFRGFEVSQRVLVYARRPGLLLSAWYIFCFLCECWFGRFLISWYGPPSLGEELHVRALQHAIWPGPLEKTIFVKVGEDVINFWEFTG